MLFMNKKSVLPSLVSFAEREIIPKYEAFDEAHGTAHVCNVIKNSLKLASGYDADINMVYAAAAYHDLGLAEGREMHHIVSGRIIRSDKALRRWFSSGQIEMIAQAAEDHRASAAAVPRSIYGRILAEADRDIKINTIIMRTIQYELAHNPEGSRKEHIKAVMKHLHEKYGRQGYLKLYIPGSDNEKELHRLWDILDNEPAAISLVNDIFLKLC